MTLKRLICIGMILCLLTGLGIANASLITIGTALYDGGTYNLVYDNDAPSGSIVWLDYTRDPAHWLTQNGWAAGLEENITSYNIFPNYSVTWTGSRWRLPDTGANPIEGYNQVSSEMGHLYYQELGLLSYPDRGDKYVTNDELNMTNFDNLVSGYYWIGNTGNYGAGAFNMNIGYQGFYDSGASLFGIAVRNANVSTVPIPGALWLFASGVAGLVTLKRRKKF